MFRVYGVYGWAPRVQGLGFRAKRCKLQKLCFPASEPRMSKDIAASEGTEGNKVHGERLGATTNDLYPDLDPTRKPKPQTLYLYPMHPKTCNQRPVSLKGFTL